MKKIFLSVIIFSLIFSNINIGYAERMSTYDNLVAIDDPFVYKIKQGGVTDELLKSFLGELDDLVSSFKEDIYMSDTDTYFITMLLQTMREEENIPVLVAFDMMFQDEIEYMLNHKKVPPSMTNFKLILFNDKVLVEPGISEEEENTNPLPDSPQPEEEKLPFDDLESVPWCVGNIINLYNRNIVIGSGNNKFEPDNKITREEFLKMLLKAFYPDTDFSYENNEYWYFPYFNYANEKNLLDGIYNDLSTPGIYITRQEMAAIAYRVVCAVGVKLPNDKYSTDFYDMSEINYYATEAIKELQEADIIHGYNNMFKPNDTSTRADAAKIIDNLLNKSYK